MAAPRITSYPEFWHYYLAEHSLKSCRLLHYLGSVSAIVLLIGVVVTGQFAWLWLPLVAGYGPAWIGHFAFQKNRPATFHYPWWSFVSDFKMLYCALSGKLDKELEQALKKG